MPFKDSVRSEETVSDQQPLREGSNFPASTDEMETPTEADVQAQAEHEFETQREIPASCKKAIVSVNGKDVDEVSLTHHRVA